jgi:hypothetical protein
MPISRRGFIRSLGSTIPVFSFDQLLSGLPLAVQFVNVAREAGLRAKTIFGSERKNKFLLETTGCGCAFFDFDNDGWLDIFLVNGTRFEAKWPPGQAPGVLVADFDNDGWPDIYVANDSTSSALYQNNRDGTFTDIGIEAGAATAPMVNRKPAWAMPPASTATSVR